jgi:hypothetical protein
MIKTIYRRYRKQESAYKTVLKTISQKKENEVIKGSRKNKTSEKGNMQNNNINENTDKHE